MTPLIEFEVFLDTTPPPISLIDGDQPGYVHWLEVCGTEVINGARTLEYIRSANAAGNASRLVLEGGQMCSVLYRDDVGDSVVYVDPVTDAAPWYDAQRPESGDFLGIMLSQAPSGLDSMAQRTTTDRPSRFGGAVIGPQRFIGRRLTFDGYIFASSFAGQEYGKRWLAHVLASVGCDPCSRCDARIRTSCPPDDGSYDSVNLWSLYQVAAVDGPAYTANPDGCAEYCAFEFTIAAGDPYLYTEASDCLEPTILNPLDTNTGGCINFDDWMCGPGGAPEFCTISPPTAGTVGAIVTISAPDGVGDIVVATYATCPPAPTDEPLTRILVPGVLGKLVIDSAKRVATYTDLDGNVFDGTPYMQLPTGGAFEWAEVSDCDAASCVSVNTLAPSSGGSTTLVSIQTQQRYE